MAIRSAFMLLVALTIATTTAPQAHAREVLLPSKEVQLVAYGEGVTVCDVTVSLGRVAPHLFFPPYAYEGETTCTAPIEQTGRAWTSLETGPLCSTVGMICRSAGESMGGSWAKYHVTLRAPRGQGWIAVPDDCSGAGTDNLDCTFTAELV